MPAQLTVPVRDGDAKIVAVSTENVIGAAVVAPALKLVILIPVPASTLAPSKTVTASSTPCCVRYKINPCEESNASCPSELKLVFSKLSKVIIPASLFPMSEILASGIVPESSSDAFSVVIDAPDPLNDVAVNDDAVTTPTTFKFFSILTFPAASMRSLSVSVPPLAVLKDIPVLLLPMPPPVKVALP